MQGFKSGISIKSVGPPVEGVYEIAEVRALRELREVAGMYCERLPHEVREALHAIPEVEKHHEQHA
jgi:hypothetical protein